MRDVNSLAPTRSCCKYFVDANLGLFSEENVLCQIDDESIYKGFHSCCISLLHNAYCYQSKIKKIKQKPLRRWSRKRTRATYQYQHQNRNNYNSQNNGTIRSNLLISSVPRTRNYYPMMLPSASKTFVIRYLN